MAIDGGGFSGDGGGWEMSAAAGIQKPTGFFDPAGFSKNSDVNPIWLRAAEIKHGRVAMLAATGWLVQAAGIHFPGYVSIKEDISFEALSKVSPADAWYVTVAARCTTIPASLRLRLRLVAHSLAPAFLRALLPQSGQWQIIGLAGAVEFWTESRQPHYLNGGDFPTIDPLGIHTVMKPDAYRIRENKELANGRLAMIGIASFWAAHTIPGAAPALPTGW